MGQTDENPEIAGGTDGTTIGNRSDSLKVNLNKADGTEIGTSANPVRTDTTGTTTQPVSAASLPLPTGASTSANQSTEITSLQLIDDLPISQSTALGSNKGVLVQGSVTTSAPSYTTGNINPLSLTPSGELRTTITSVSITAGPAPSFTSKMRAVVQTSTISITSSVTYTDVFNYSGSGLLIGFNTEFNSSAIVVKLTVDSEVIFDGNDISALNALTATANTTSRYQMGAGMVTAGSMLDFSTRQPIKYATNVTVSARLTSGAVSKNFTQGIFYLTKET